MSLDKLTKGDKNIHKRNFKYDRAKERDRQNQEMPESHGLKTSMNDLHSQVGNQAVVQMLGKQGGNMPIQLRQDTFQNMGNMAIQRFAKNEDGSMEVSGDLSVPSPTTTMGEVNPEAANIVSSGLGVDAHNVPVAQDNNFNDQISAEASTVGAGGPGTMVVARDNLSTDTAVHETIHAVGAVAPDPVQTSGGYGIPAADGKSEMETESLTQNLMGSASTLQAKQEEGMDNAIQAKAIQREEMPEEEMLQQKAIQREEMPEEEMIEAKAIQREEAPEEEMIEAKAIQREETEEGCLDC